MNKATGPREQSQNDATEQFHGEFGGKYLHFNMDLGGKGAGIENVLSLVNNGR